MMRVFFFLLTKICHVTKSKVCAAATKMIKKMHKTHLLYPKMNRMFLSAALHNFLPRLLKKLFTHNQIYIIFE